MDFVFLLLSSSTGKDCSGIDVALSVLTQLRPVTFASVFN